MELNPVLERLAQRSALPVALACAIVAFNVLAVIKAALRAAHGAEIEETLSSHAMAGDLRDMGRSLQVIADAQDWEVFRQASLAAMAEWLPQQRHAASRCGATPRRGHAASRRSSGRTSREGLMLRCLGCLPPRRRHLEITPSFAY